MRYAKPDERTFASESPMAGRKQLIALALLTLPGMLHSAGVVAAPFDGFAAGGALTAVGILDDRLGRGRLALIGAVAFTAASVLAAFGSGARLAGGSNALHRFAAAILAPSARSLLRGMFPDPKDRALASSTWTSSFALGAAIGPTVGGFLLDHFLWTVGVLASVVTMALLFAAIILPGADLPTIFGVIAKRLTDLLGLADFDEGEVLGFHVGGRHPLHIFHRHGVDQVVALRDVVDAEIVLPEAHQVLRDLGVGVEIEREGAGQVGFGVHQFLFGRAFGAELGDVLLHQADHFAGLVVHGRA
jgi:MFS family permease